MHIEPYHSTSVEPYRSTSIRARRMDHMASNDPSICVQGSYDTSDDMSDHSKSTEINVPSLSEDDTQRVDKQAQEFYSNYAKKVGFVNKIRNTNFDKTRKESRIPINQSIHCNREGYQESHVKAASQQSIHYHEYRKLTMHAKCVIEDNDEAGIQPNKIYLALANEVGGSSNLDYSEKDVRNYITGNLHCADENADIKKMLSYFSQMKEINPKFFYVVDVNASNKFRSALWVNTRCWASYEYYGDVTFITIIKGGFQSIFKVNFGLVRGVPRRMRVCTLFTVVSYITRVGWFSLCMSMTTCLGLMSKKNWKTILQILKELSPAHPALQLKDNFSMSTQPLCLGRYNRNSGKKGDCSVRGVTQDGDLFCVTVDEQYLLYREPRKCTNLVEFDPLTYRVFCECNMFESREYHLVMFSLDGAKIYSANTLSSRVATMRSDRKKATTYSEDCDFVTCEEVAAMLHSGLDDLRAKLFNYRANLGSKGVATTQNSMRTQSQPVGNQGRTRLKRLGSELDNLIKSMRRKKKNEPPICVYHFINFEFTENGEAVNHTLASQEHGAFMSLLNSFGNT
ncbi:hypothetical protein Ahy_B01g052746 [Arachis hypogaea]|uniref:Uncharacterized protein n=1 Tax=Arachis hypogaea TaxID=3818 RepID=A0A445AQE9_ARAHY|nr:hypothetical protein Ahy_B01g052746 [Arachis hypogaea]